MRRFIAVLFCTFLLASLCLPLTAVAAEKVVVNVSNTTAANKVFDGFSITVLDKTVPAVNMQGRINDRNVMCFVSATGQEVGVISYKDYNAIIAKNQKIVELEDGGTLGLPPKGSNWNEWFADEFNSYRGLNVKSRVESTESQNSKTIEEYRQDLIRLVNLEREKVGLPAYIVNDDCMEYSQIRAQELPTSFSHTRLDGTNAGYEVIADTSSPEGAVHRWMNSSGHKAAILNENRMYVGAGVYITLNNTLFFQMYFERDPDVYANTFIFG